MNTDSVISVEKISKSFQINHLLQGPDTLRDSIMRGLRNIATARMKKPQGSEKETFWALRDVSFEVKRGEVVGIVGRNGAGKSTLLKILSRITSPSVGRIVLDGRIGSLLEVGTGFHPELTGRENIFLNGAILGMKRTEIQDKFDEIVDFAEVSKFLDTQVKHYSSGMYMRLAFAVAAHLEPEILIVDEVLAVGDSQFQRKCLGKMEDISKGGRTILFVSHNMAAVQNLCSRVIVLDKGAVEFDGNTAKGIERYLSTGKAQKQSDLSLAPRQGGNGRALITGLSIEANHNPDQEIARSGDDVIMRIQVEPKDVNLKEISLAIGINSAAGENLLHFWTQTSGFEIERLNTKTVMTCTIPRLPLSAGVYSISLFLTASGQVLDWLSEITTFEVENGDFYRTGRLPPSNHSRFLHNCQWGVTCV